MHYSYPSDETPWQGEHTPTHTHKPSPTCIYSNSTILSYQWQGWEVIHPQRCSGLFLHCHQILQLSPVCNAFIHIHAESDFYQRAPLYVCGNTLGVAQAKHTHLMHKHTHFRQDIKSTYFIWKIAIVTNHFDCLKQYILLQTHWDLFSLAFCFLVLKFQLSEQLSAPIRTR